MNTTIDSQSTDRAGDSHKLPLHPLVVCAVLFATSALAPADVVLRGQVGARVIQDDVIIARGTTCVLNGTTIKGSVRVRSGAKLYANGAWVDGSVYAHNALLVDFRNSSRVTWSVRGNGTRAIRLRDDTLVGGHVSLLEGSAPDGVEALVVQNSSIKGDIWAGSCTGRLSVRFNKVEGRLKFVENNVGPYAIRNNDVWHDIEFIRNNGSGFIINNTVGGNLVSIGNTPNAEIRSNVVRGDRSIE